MLNKVYLYAVGAVLALGIIMPFDAHAGSVQICINGMNLQGQACNTGNNTNQKIKATGYDALEIITQSKVEASGISNNGWSYFVVSYNGSRFNNIRGRTFSCKVSPDASSFECYSWPKYR